MAKLMIDRTFVRVGGESQSLRQMSQRHFAEWAATWYGRWRLHYEDSREATTPEQREEVLTQMVRNGCPPVMLVEKEVPDG